MLIFWTLKNGLFYSLERRLYYVEHQPSLFRALFSSKLDEDKTLKFVVKIMGETL